MIEYLKNYWEAIMEDSMFIKTVDGNGNEVMYEILMTFYLKDSGKDYVVYMDIDNDDIDRDINIYVSVYDLDNNMVIDEEINEEEWGYIEEIINSF